jgi:hypothetical protein
MNRGDILRQAETLVSNDRELVYGPPRLNQQRIADLYNAYWKHRDGEFTVSDVVIFAILTKIARLIQSPGNLDTWVDIAGYSALGGELSQNKPKG